MPHDETRRLRTRSGSALIWLLVAFPVIVLTFLGVVALGSVWLARAELMTVADAAALAGAKRWGDGPNNPANRTSAHLAAKAVAEANTVLGVAPVVNANNDPSQVNNNQSFPGDIELGRLTGTLFAADSPGAPPNQRACRVQLTSSVTPPFFGAFLGPFPIHAQSVAVYSPVPGGGTPRLVIITQTTVP